MQRSTGSQQNYLIVPTTFSERSDAALPATDWGHDAPDAFLLPQRSIHSPEPQDGQVLLVFRARAIHDHAAEHAAKQCAGFHLCRSFRRPYNISKVMYVVILSIKKTTTPIVVVLPTLSSARITDGVFANGMTMIHWRQIFDKAPRLLPIQCQFTLN